jgi:hypothetical protein
LLQALTFPIRNASVGWRFQFESCRPVAADTAPGHAPCIAESGMIGRAFLFSIVLGSIVIPLRAARDANAARGLKKALSWGLVFNGLYYLAAVFIYPRL